MEYSKSRSGAAKFSGSKSAFFSIAEIEVGENDFQSASTMGKELIPGPVAQINSSVRGERKEIKDRKRAAKVSGKSCNRNSSTAKSFTIWSSSEVLTMISGCTSILAGMELEWADPLAPFIRARYEKEDGSRVIKTKNGEFVKIQVKLAEFHTSPVPLLVTAGFTEDRRDGLTQHPQYIVTRINGQPEDNFYLNNVNWAYNVHTVEGFGGEIYMQFEIYRPSPPDGSGKCKRNSERKSRFVCRVYNLQQTDSGFVVRGYNQLLSDAISVGQQYSPKITHINVIEWNCGGKFRVQLIGDHFKSKKLLPEVSVSLEYLGSDFGKIDTSIICHEDTKNKRLTFMMSPMNCGSTAKVKVTVTVDEKIGRADFDVYRGEGSDATLLFRKCEPVKAELGRKRKLNVKIEQKSCPSPATQAQQKDILLNDLVLNGESSMMESKQHQPLTTYLSVYNPGNTHTPRVQPPRYWPPETARHDSLREVPEHPNGSGQPVSYLTTNVNSLPHTFGSDLNQQQSAPNNAQDLLLNLTASNGENSMMKSIQDQPFTAYPSVYHPDNIQTPINQPLHFYPPLLARQDSLRDVPVHPVHPNGSGHIMHLSSAVNSFSYPLNMHESLPYQSNSQPNEMFYELNGKTFPLPELAGNSNLGPERLGTYSYETMECYPRGHFEDLFN